MSESERALSLARAGRPESLRRIIAGRIGPESIKICAYCDWEKRADGTWTPQRESTREFIRRGVPVSHGYCPPCHKRQLATLYETEPPPAA